uniref:Uncharacterized protein n=1 Tax=uncultured haloarchaeon TaxID=160804 RepID=A0A0K1YBF5_9EURY|nr:hypothetical protein [uncultured haloarchaeon]
MSHSEGQNRSLALMLILISLITTGLLLTPLIAVATPTPTQTPTSTTSSTPSSSPESTTEPTITLAVNGDSLSSSESITVGSSPDLALSVSVNGSEELTAVRVAVDNETRRIYNTSTLNQTLTRELDIPLRNGAHTIDIKTTTQRRSPSTERTHTNNTSTETALKTATSTATVTSTSNDNAAGQATATPTSSPTDDAHETQNSSIQTYVDSFTIIVDTAAPLVQYTSPFESSAAAPPPDRPIVTNSTVMLAGTFQDRSAVTAVQITHIYEYDFAGRSQSTRSVYRFSPTNGSFTRPLVLGVGENEITAEYTDRFGNIRRHEITIRLIDISAPQITLDRPIPSRVGYETLQIRGSVTDGVKLNRIDFLTPSGGTKRLLIQQGPEPTRERRSVSISETVQLSPGRNYMQIDATDVSGNAREREATVFYDESIAPKISIESIAVSDSASRSPTVRVTGRITREDIVDARIEIRNVEPENNESLIIQRSLTSTATNSNSNSNSNSTTHPETTQRRIQFDEELPLRNVTDPVLLRISASDTENDTESVTRQLSSITPSTERDSEDIDSPSSAITTNTTPSSTALSTESTASPPSSSPSSSSSMSTPLGVTPIIGAICVIVFMSILVTRTNR